MPNAATLRLFALAALASTLACANSDGDTSPSEASAGSTSAGDASTDPTGSTGPTSSTGDSSSTGDASEATSNSTDPSSTSTGETDPGTTTDTSDTDDTTESGDTEDTDDTACVPGELDCVCADGACDEGLSCVDDLCALSLECDDDPDEPNQTEATATVLPELTDDDDDESSVIGVLSSEADVDWYRFIGQDTLFHTTEPTASLEADEGLRFCMFLDCLEDGPLKTEVSCPGGTDAETSPAGRKGCCSDAGFELKDYNCPGGDDSLLVFLRLDKPQVDACVDYSVSYFL